MLPARVPIPDSLYSTETDEPISSCLVCDRPLLDGSTPYLIEKSYRQYDAYDVRETLFGYALCLDCHQTMQQSLSEESRRRCRAYLATHVDIPERMAALRQSDSTDPSDWMQQCAVHDTPVDDLQEFQVLAHCQGNEMVLSHLPIVLGETAIDELTELLSDKTIDDLGGFREEHFGLPPDLKQNVRGPALA